jgi:hypothetical protein
MRYGEGFAIPVGTTLVGRVLVRFVADGAETEDESAEPRRHPGNTRQDMREKIFLKKGSRTNKSPSSPSSFFQFRNLFKFGIILLFWIAFIPLLWHQKNKSADDKSTPPKVVKEIPKTSVPAGNADGGAPARDTGSAASPVGDKPVAPQPAPQATPQPTPKAETPPATGASPASSAGPMGGRYEDAGKPPIGPVPEVRPPAPAATTTTVTREPVGQAAGKRPAVGDTVGSSPDKPGTGVTSVTREKTKPVERVPLAEKPKSAGTGAPVDKPKPGVTAGASVDKPKPGAATGASTASPAPKTASPKEQQPRATTPLTKLPAQPPPTATAPGDRSKPPATDRPKTATTTTPKPAPSAAVSGAQGTPPSPPADKPTESSAAINWLYILRLGSFNNPSQAQELQKKLQQKGYAVAVKKHQNLQKGQVYHVDLKTRDGAEAKAQLDKLQREEKVNPVLLKVAETR